MIEELNLKDREGLLAKIEENIKSSHILTAAKILEHYAREHPQYIGEREIKLYCRIEDSFLKKDTEYLEEMYEVMKGLFNIFGAHKMQLIHELRKEFGAEKKAEELRQRLHQ